MPSFRVALSGDFLTEDGSPAYPMFDLGPLMSDPEIAVVYVTPDENGVVPARALAGCDALILLAHRFNERSIPADGRLKIVARFGVGYDTVDIAACTKAGIAVTIAPDGVRRPVAVSVLTFLFALAGQLLYKDRLTRMGAPGWDLRSNHMGVGLTGRSFGQLGIGNIGAEVLRLARPLGMHFIAHDPFVDVATAEELGVELVSLEDLFIRSDFLSVSVPLNEKTRGMVDASLIGLMKPTAYLINTARGPIVDQKALYDALVSRSIAGAGLDVFEVEPAPIDEPILHLDNVIVTPHSLCFSDECFAGLGADCLRNVLAVKQGRLPKAVVNGDVLEAPAWRLLASA
jgi:phosphoglycerate dehydrogenase-like enzyme